MALLSAATSGALTLWAPAASTQPKVIEVPQKRPKPQCVDYPPVLGGTFKQTLFFTRGDYKQTHVTNGRVSWKLQSVYKNDPAPSNDVAIDKFHAKAQCPVAFYMIQDG